MSEGQDIDSVAVIVPVLNEASTLPDLLAHLAQCGAQEIVIVDGGSNDGSAELVNASGVTLIRSAPGRARQMNHGAQRAKSDCLLFLHADTRLPCDWRSQLKGQWGRFNVQFGGSQTSSGLLITIGLMMIAWFMNWRSRLSGIATGDQAIFVRRHLFDDIGGYPTQSLMEDVELSTRLKAHAKPTIIKSKVTTSARRWEQKGLWQTIVLMWRLRLAYALGANPSRLKRHYHDIR